MGVAASTSKAEFGGRVPVRRKSRKPLAASHNILLMRRKKKRAGRVKDTEAEAEIDTEEDTDHGGGAAVDAVGKGLVGGGAGAAAGGGDADGGVSSWILRGLPRGPTRSLSGFVRYLQHDMPTEAMQGVICTLGSFPWSDWRHLSEEDKEYITAYVWDLWMALPVLVHGLPGDPEALACASLCKTVQDVLRVLVAFLEGKTVGGLGHPAVDPETVPLLSSFVRLHRLGIITYSSQPEKLDSRTELETIGLQKLVENGQGYEWRQDGYISGYIPLRFLDKMVRFVEIHPSKRVSAHFNFLTRDGSPEFRTVGYKGRLNEKYGFLSAPVHFDKRVRLVNEEGQPQSPWVSNAPDHRVVNRFGFAKPLPDDPGSMSGAHRFHSLDIFGLPEATLEACRDHYVVMFHLEAYADDEAIDLPDDLAKFFDDIVAPQDRVLGDAPTLFGYIEKAHDALKAAGVTDLPQFKARKQEYIRDMAKQQKSRFEGMLDTIEDEYDDYITEWEDLTATALGPKKPLVPRDDWIATRVDKGRARMKAFFKKTYVDWTW